MTVGVGARGRRIPPKTGRSASLPAVVRDAVHHPELNRRAADEPSSSMSNGQGQKLGIAVMQFN
jgi:hypothetical protein